MSFQDSSARPPVPAYGEYAPGHVPAPPAPLAPPQQQQPYGLQPYGQQPYYAPPAANQGRRIGDIVTSTILLVVGFFSVGFTVLMAFVLGDAVQQQYDAYDLGIYDPGTGLVMAQATIIASHLVLYLIVAAVTIALIVKRKISFWVPLAGGFLAAVIFWIALIALMMTDPTLMGAMQTQPLP